MNPIHARRLRLWSLGLLYLLTGLTGCTSLTCVPIPANRVPPELLAHRRNDLAPIDLTLLRQHPPKDYLLGPHDLIGVYIQDIVPSAASRQEPPVIVPNWANQSVYYPANGLINAPAVGLPLEIPSSGMLHLPLINPVRVEGLTLTQAADLIRRNYTEQMLLQPGKDRTLITLIRPRVHRVLVIREDNVQSQPVLTRRDAYVLSRRGTANVVDLPAYENDVLHALIATGGLPGQEARNEVWVLRTRAKNPQELEAIRARVAAGEAPQQVLDGSQLEWMRTRIPLRLCHGEPMPFAPEDIVLADGDVVFLGARDEEFFYTGGLLPGGQIPLPRDYDLDVLGAIALANGSVWGPAGGGAATIFRSGSGPGNIIPPTVALITRSYPNGQQALIRCNVRRAQHDPMERVIIQPGDVVVLKYTASELAANIVLNAFQLNATYLIGGS